MLSDHIEMSTSGYSHIILKWVSLKWLANCCHHNNIAADLRCPVVQEYHTCTGFETVSGPDKWLFMGTVLAGGSHGLPKPQKNK